MNIEIDVEQFARDIKAGKSIGGNDGSQDACYNISMNYFNGNLLPEDHLKSFQYALLGCDNGHAKSCDIVGLNYEHGIMVPEDKKTALKYYDRSCKLREEKGCEGYQRLRVKKSWK